jgi:hypothetical protein
MERNSFDRGIPFREFLVAPLGDCWPPEGFVLAPHVLVSAPTNSKSNYLRVAPVPSAYLFGTLLDKKPRNRGCGGERFSLARIPKPAAPSR